MSRRQEAIHQPGDSRQRPGFKAVASLVMAGSILATTASCSAVAKIKHPHFVAQPCSSATINQAKRLGSPKSIKLQDELPVRRLEAKRGTIVDVISKSGHTAMTFAEPQPKNAVCEVSQHRASNGATDVEFVVEGSGDIDLSSTFEKVTNAAMPAMIGKIVVE